MLMIKHFPHIIRTWPSINCQPLKYHLESGKNMTLRYDVYQKVLGISYLKRGGHTLLRELNISFEYNFEMSSTSLTY